MPEEHAVTEFKKLFEVLASAEVDFILIGGLAGIVHGLARNTYDMDLVYSRQIENLEKIVKALKPFNPYLRGAPPGLPFLWDVKTLQRGLNFTLITTLGEIDLLGEAAGGGTYQDLLEHSFIGSFLGIECRCVSLQKLIVLKRAAGRPKDFEMLAQLEALLDEQENLKNEQR